MQKNKRFIFLSCLLIAGAVASSPLKAASSHIALYFNNKPLKTASSPFIEKGVTLVPMRPIFEALGAQVAWSSDTQTIIAKKNTISIALTIGKKTAFIDTTKKTLPSAPQLKQGNVYVPLRFISESLGADVKWDNKSQTVSIHSSKQTESARKQLSFQDIGKKTNAVVYIDNVQTDGNSGYGSGFVISEDGKIATNYHVIAKAKKLTIYLENGKKYEDVSILAYNLLKDVAILKINSNDKFPFCKLGNSDQAALGESVAVIGNPRGYQNTLSNGIISSLKDKNYIQITAAISPGSSGGALFNMYGEVIGIPSAIDKGGQNLGFCIPINFVRELPLGTPLTLAEFNKVSNTLKAPQNVKATALSPTEVALQWDDAKTADYYHIYWADTLNGKYTPCLASNGEKQKFYWANDYCEVFDDFLPETTGYFKVTAVLNGIESPFSEAVGATTPKDDFANLINIVKEGSFETFPDKKIGTHFSELFRYITWKYYISDSKEEIVEFKGHSFYNDKDTEIIIRFTVNRSDRSFKPIYMSKDGTEIPSPQFTTFINLIFNS